MGIQNKEAKTVYFARAFLHAFLDFAVRFKIQFFGDYTDIFSIAFKRILSFPDRH